MLDAQPKHQSSAAPLPYPVNTLSKPSLFLRSMAAYYAPRRPRSVSRVSVSLIDDRDEATAGEQSQDVPPLALHSVYIFPSPASAPPSPATSVSSAPTEFDFSSPIASRPSSRTRLPQSAVSDVSSFDWDASTPSGNDLEVEIELWDAASDLAAGPSDSEESWAFEGEVERIGLASVDVPYAPQSYHARQAPLSPTQYHDATRTRYRLSARPRPRSRTRSRVRTISISSLALSSTQQTAPHPRIHIPLLSFFSSLLSIDLDDPALRLLSNAEPGDAEAILFPGQNSARLLAEAEEQRPGRRSFDSDSETETESTGSGELPPYDVEAETHGLPKLLLASISDHSTVALRSLRAGLAVRIPTTASHFTLPLPRGVELVGLWRALGEVCSKGSQAWKEVWGATSSQGH